MTDKFKHIIQELLPRFQPHQAIGIGSGSTVEAVLRSLLKQSPTIAKSIRVVSTSDATSWLCRELGFQVVEAGGSDELDWGFDGADQVDKSLRAIKGRGGAMFAEKIVAESCRTWSVLVGHEKLTETLGVGCPVPVEITSASRFRIERELVEFGAKEVSLRIAESLSRKTPYYTCNGNLVLDAEFDAIPDDLECRLSALPGVAACGLFLTQASEVLIELEDGLEKLTRLPKQRV